VIRFFTYGADLGWLEARASSQVNGDYHRRATIWRSLGSPTRL
jgi:hypothetical protein